MTMQPTTSSSLDLTISVPGFSSSSSPSPSPSPSLPPDVSCFGAKGLDINQVPSGDGEDEWITGNMDDEEVTINGCPPRKKLRLKMEQSRLLEESFRLNHTLNPKLKEALAMQLKLRPRQIEVWFQNRRARRKLKQTESECEYLRRWFGSLTEQNSRLQREVEELRGIKVGPPTLMSPASTLTMCPRCERVTTTMHDKGPTTSPATVATLSPKVTAPIIQSRPSSAAC